jgi:hypothetical protein
VALADNLDEFEDCVRDLSTHDVIEPLAHR